MKSILDNMLYLSLKRIYKKIIIIILIITLYSCKQGKNNSVEHSINQVAITPTPYKILYKRGNYSLEKSTRMLLNLSAEEENYFAEHLINSLLIKTGKKFKIADRFTTDKITKSIEILYGNNKSIKFEGYKINIAQNKVKIYANDANGITYAINQFVTILTKSKNNKWLAPQLIIEDYPKTSIRAIYLNSIDSTNYKVEDMLNLLIKYRFNYLITDSKMVKSNPHSTIKIVNSTSSLTFNWRNNLIENKSIHEFYLTDTNSTETIVFKIKNKALLHPDSLAQLSEAMWSQTKNLNYIN